MKTEHDRLRTIGTALGFAFVLVLLAAIFGFLWAVTA